MSEICSFCGVGMDIHGSGCSSSKLESEKPETHKEKKYREALEEIIRLYEDHDPSPHDRFDFFDVAKEALEDK